MKFPFALGVCLSAITWLGAAQPDASPPANSSRKIARGTPLPDSPTPAPDGFTRFDLDFPGGTPADLAAAITKATGKHLNLIIPAEQADVKLMPFKVADVTVPDLFAGIVNASEGVISVPNRTGYELRKTRVEFLPVQNGKAWSDQTIWAFRSNAPELAAVARESVDREARQSPQVVSCYFQLSPYLENYSIEDITTAIQAGWKMAKVEPMPELSFHKETKLLIAVGPEANVISIPQVLAQLRMDRSPAVEKIVALQREIDELEAGHAPGADKKIDEARHKIAEIACRQKANEEIDNGGRRPIRSAPVPPPN